MRALRLLALSLVLPATLVAQAPQISDSAGARVITNAAPGANAPTFRLSARPRASIGAVEGAPAYELASARQATVLRDGNILLINKASAFVERESWHVFDPRGAFIGKLDLPAKTQIFDAGADWILLKQTDELDVEHVVLYGLERIPGR